MMYGFGFVREAVTNAIRDTLLPQHSEYSTWSLKKDFIKTRVGEKATPINLVASELSDKSEPTLSEIKIETVYKEEEIWTVIETRHLNTYKPLVDKHETKTFDCLPEIFINPTDEQKKIILEKTKYQTYS